MSIYFQYALVDIRKIKIELRPQFVNQYTDEQVLQGLLDGTLVYDPHKNSHIYRVDADGHTAIANIIFDISTTSDGGKQMPRDYKLYMHRHDRAARRDATHTY